METSHLLIAGVGALVCVGYFVLMKKGGSGSKKGSSSTPFLTTSGIVHHVTLIHKTNVSHDTRRFRFALPSPDMRLGLPVGKHFTLYAPNATPSVAGQWNGREDTEAGKEKIDRKYTPTSSDDELGYFELVIKVYTPNERFADGGKMSQYLDTLVPGKDQVEMRGPFGLIEYKGHGLFEYSRKPLPVKRNVGMLAGGTGITPMLQIVAAILKDKADTTNISLLFANQTEEDILVREELETLAKEHPTRFKLTYTLDRPPSGWKYESGFITEAMLRKHMPAPADDTVILICGPPPMVKFACQDNLKLIGYPATQQLVF